MPETLIPHVIAGSAAAEPERTGPVLDPATGEQTGRVVFASAADVDAAVRRGAEAFADWGRRSITQRTRVMFRFRALVEQHIDELARIISSEHGKVLDDARGEVQRGLEVADFACGIAELTKGEFSEQVSTGIDALSFRQPLGVCAGITPFNFPAMVPLWMHPIAIATGNAFILKPSERVPSVSNRIAELYAEAGLPDGVFQVVHGDRVAVEALLDHPGVAAVSFVGSTAIARTIHERATLAGKRVQALGGAKNHAVVLPDADIGYVCEQLVSAGFGSAGQRCMAISVVVAVGDVGDRLVAALRERARTITVGPGLDSGSEMGPLITAAARDRVGSYLADAPAGADVVLDGREHERWGEGFFVGPSIVDHVTPEMGLYTDEIFGPLLSIVRAESLGEAIDLINGCDYANGTAIFTGSGHAAREFQHRVQVGMIGINVPIPVPMAYYSFGGWKDSLFGDTHIHGREGVRFYTRAKAVTTRWPTASEAEGASFSFPTQS